MIELLFVILILSPIIIFIIKKISVYNRLIELTEEIEESNKNLLGEYNKHINLISEFRQISKCSSDFEEKILDKVLKARENNIKQTNLTEKVIGEDTVAKTLGSAVTLLVENYPTVTSTETYREFMKKFKDSNDSLQAAIRVHTSNIRTYNVFRQSFTGQFFAQKSFPKHIEYPALEKLEEKKLRDLLPVSYQSPLMAETNKKELKQYEEKSNNTNPDG